MSVECIFFDCDGTLVDSEVICTQSYVNTFARYGIELSLQQMFEQYKGVKLYDIIRDVTAQHQVTLPLAEVESAYARKWRACLILICSRLPAPERWWSA